MFFRYNFVTELYNSKYVYLIKRGTTYKLVLKIISYYLCEMLHEKLKF